MRTRDTLADLRLLAGRVVLRRGIQIAALAMLERSLMPVAAWTLFESSLAYKLASSLGLVVAFTARTFMEEAFAARTEAELLARTGKSILWGDMLKASILPDEDARFELGLAVYQCSTILARTAPNLLADVAAGVVLAAFIASREPGAAVASAAGLTAAAVGALALSRRAVDRSVSRAVDLQKQVEAAFVDALEGRVEIVAAGVRKTVFDGLERNAGRWGSAAARAAGAAVLAGRIPLLGVVGLVILGLLVRPWPSGSNPIKTLDLALFASIAPAFAGIGQNMYALIRSRRRLQDAAKVLRTERHDSMGEELPSLRPSRIQFERVTFRYDEASENALRQFDLDWGNERILALSGPNGSGKSTVVRLLLAMAHPSSGTLRIDARDMTDIDRDAWRAGIAYLPQRPYLPSRADVRRAVRWPRNEASDVAVSEALRRVGLLAVLERMGGDPLAVAVDSLSVGQRQRIALARTICQDAHLLILDEPDANLDVAGVALLAGVLQELSNTRRILLVAHAPELLSLAQRVVSLGGGREMPFRTGAGPGLGAQDPGDDRP